MFTENEFLLPAFIIYYLFILFVYHLIIGNITGNITGITSNGKW